MDRKSAGVIIIIIGIVMLVYTGFGFVTTQKVVDIGNIQVKKEKNNYVQWPPIVGILLVAGGIVILATKAKSGK